MRDLGVGFDPDGLDKPQKNLGIAGMRARVHSVGGLFRLESKLGQGTLIEVSVPRAAENMGD